jgi:hypothetical protein
MRYAIIVLMTSSLLTACAGTNSNLALPDVIEYSKETQIKAARELETQNVPTLAEFMKDYKVMRDQVRVAKH